MSVTIVNNSKQVLTAFDKQLQNGLIAVGLEAQTYAKEECPVDTSRLKNSITSATTTQSDNKDTPFKPEDGATHATPEKTSVYIGTNVEYAEKIETNTNIKHTNGKAHFLRDAAAQHGKRYESIVKAALTTY